MAETTVSADRFGEIAVNLNMISQQKLNRSLVVQKMIFERTKVHMPIGKVLKEMGALTQEQIDTVLETQRYLYEEAATAAPSPPPVKRPAVSETLAGLKLIVSEDKLSAYLAPTDVVPCGLTLENVKAYLSDQNVEFGLVPDQELSDYLALSPLPGEPFKVAAGVAPIEGRPSEIIYHFDTDPLRIGTLKSDGTMDWKNRGEIPQVNVGDLLAEKTPADPGSPGTNVYGQTLPPPRVRDPKLKCGKGAQRSEDGMQILAKADGTPKLASDGKILVFGTLNIEGDVGVETGNIEFEGYVEVEGSVTAGYSVKAKGLRTAGIQDALIEVEQDLTCDGGVYGTTIKAGGDTKASHIHNCTLELLGDLVVRKEIFDSTVETNGQCLIPEGKILTSQIDAKKGVEALEIGSVGSKPCQLTVGFDRKYERDRSALEVELEELQAQKIQIKASSAEQQVRLETIEKEIAPLAKEQEAYRVQLRQFEEQLRGEGPNPVEGEEECAMLQEMIAELVEITAGIDTRVGALQAEQDQLRLQIAGHENSLKILDEHAEQSREKIEQLEEALKMNPGIPAVKVRGTIFNKTRIIGRHKEMVLAEDMQRVRIAEVKEDPAANRYTFRISNLT